MSVSTDEDKDTDAKTAAALKVCQPILGQPSPSPSPTG